MNFMIKCKIPLKRFENKNKYSTCMDYLLEKRTQMINFKFTKILNRTTIFKKKILLKN